LTTFSKQFEDKGGSKPYLLSTTGIDLSTGSTADAERRVIISWKTGDGNEPCLIRPCRDTETRRPQICNRLQGALTCIRM